MWCSVDSEAVFISFLWIVNCKENRLKINITPHVENLLVNLLRWNKIWYLEGYMFEQFFTTEKLWDGLPVFWK